VFFLVAIVLDTKTDDFVLDFARAGNSCRMGQQDGFWQTAITDTGAERWPKVWPDNHRTQTGQTPYKGRMHTGCGAVFAVVCVAAEGSKGWCLSESCLSLYAPAPILSHIFSIAGSNTGAEREACQGRASFARSSQRSADP
jgi:hypothetical protein